jgi:CCR4-NOT transcription complex subunit 2
MSAADRWGLLGLLAMIKNADPDQALLSVGTDLGTMGLDITARVRFPIFRLSLSYLIPRLPRRNLFSTFITPWADSSAAHTVEPDYHLPGCYNVQPPPPGPGKAAAFSDETLFFMFYSSPRDALQEIAAQEL